MGAITNLCSGGNHRKCFPPDGCTCHCHPIPGRELREVGFVIPEAIKPAHRALIKEVVGHITASLTSEPGHLLDLFSCERCKRRVFETVQENEMECPDTKKTVSDCKCGKCRAKRRATGGVSKDLTKVRAVKKPH